MADKFSLIDFQAIGDVTNNLINKLSDAIGWVASRDTLKKKALETYVKEINESDDPPLIKAAKICNAKKDIKNYINQRNIVAIASQNITNASSITDVDDDWIAQFMDMAKLISDRDFQMIWGRIFAEECNRPGAIPKSTLFILQKMDKEDAISFTNFSKFVINVCGENTPFFPKQFFTPSADEARIYISNKIDFDVLTRLESLGLIKIDISASGTGFAISGKERKTDKIIYYNHDVSIPKSVIEIPVGVVIFTKDGEGLYRAISTSEVTGFWDRVVYPFIKLRVTKDHTS